MGKTLFILLQICLLSHAGLTQLRAQICTFTDLRLNSQAMVNAFNPDCKHIKGNIIVSGADITDLSPLAGIELIEGRLTIQGNSSLSSLRGLEKLAGTQHLLIYTNDLLSDLSGLEGLKSITGTTHIRFNKNLVSLNGLHNLTNASTLYIGDNDLLPNLSGLGSLESVTDILSITTNKKLVSLHGLTSLTNVSRILIGGNDLLPDLSGLGSLQSVSYQMHVSSNKSLVSLNGLNNLTNLSEAYISDNNLMPDLSGLEQVNAVKWLVIGENKGLTSLTGLHNLISATNIIIRNNALLTDLSGLENLTNIGWMQVAGNVELVSLAGLGSTANGQRSGSNERVSAPLAVGGLAITDNPKLTTCAISPVCDFIKTSEATISGNGTGCESQEAVETACSTLPVILADFSAAITENRATLLQWQTTAESNSSIFEIEHSPDAKAWQKAGEHAAKGESNKLVGYQWVHTTPGNGLNYYRLKMTDLDGTYAYSRIVSVSLGGRDQIPVFIYPNPVSDRLFVENMDDVVWLRIVDLQGKTVYETRYVSKEGLSVKTLARGLYQIRFARQSGVVQTQRVVIY